MRHRSLAFAAAAVLLAASAGLAITETSVAVAAAAPAVSKLAATKTALRGLWQGHIVAVRKVVAARIANNAAAVKAGEAEVVANAHSIAGAIEPFYGVPARDKLFTLLAGHYTAVKAYLEASVTKNEAGQGKATDQITANADELATFLSGANPSNWPKATLLELLSVHGSHHIEQIQELIAHDAAAEAKTRAAMSAHMNVIADALAEGLAKQFPAKFS